MLRQSGRQGRRLRTGPREHGVEHALPGLELRSSVRPGLAVWALVSPARYLATLVELDAVGGSSSDGSRLSQIGRTRSTTALALCEVVEPVLGELADAPARGSRSPPLTARVGGVPVVGGDEQDPLAGAGAVGAVQELHDPLEARGPGRPRRRFISMRRRREQRARPRRRAWQLTNSRSGSSWRPEPLVADQRLDQVLLERDPGRGVEPALEPGDVVARATCRSRPGRRRGPRRPRRTRRAAGGRSRRRGRCRTAPCSAEAARRAEWWPGSSLSTAMVPGPTVGAAADHAELRRDAWRRGRTGDRPGRESSASARHSTAVVRSHRARVAHGSVRAPVAVDEDPVAQRERSRPQGGVGRRGVGRARPPPSQSSYDGPLGIRRALRYGHAPSRRSSTYRPPASYTSTTTSFGFADVGVSASVIAVPSSAFPVEPDQPGDGGRDVGQRRPASVRPPAYLDDRRGRTRASEMSAGCSANGVEHVADAARREVPSRGTTIIWAARSRATAGRSEEDVLGQVAGGGRPGALRALGGGRPRRGSELQEHGARSCGEPRPGTGRRDMVGSGRGMIAGADSRGCGTSAIVGQTRAPRLIAAADTGTLSRHPRTTFDLGIGAGRRRHPSVRSNAARAAIPEAGRRRRSGRDGGSRARRAPSGPATRTSSGRDRRSTAGAGRATRPRRPGARRPELRGRLVERRDPGPPGRQVVGPRVPTPSHGAEERAGEVPPGLRDEGHDPRRTPHRSRRPRAPAAATSRPRRAAARRRGPSGG